MKPLNDAWHLSPTRCAQWAASSVALILVTHPHPKTYFFPILCLHNWYDVALFSCEKQELCVFERCDYWSSTQQYECNVQEAASRTTFFRNERDGRVWARATCDGCRCDDFLWISYDSWTSIDLNQRAFVRNILVEYFKSIAQCVVPLLSFTGGGHMKSEKVPDSMLVVNSTMPQNAHATS